MKLAEALILRSDTQKHLAQLKDRLILNAKVQQGDKPAEKPKELLAQFDRLATSLEALIERINRTNSQTVLPSGQTVTAALAARDVLIQRIHMFLALAKAATVTHDRYSKSEVKFIGTVDASEMQKEAERCSKEYRRLDTEIQESNWNTELVD